MKTYLILPLLLLLASCAGMNQPVPTVTAPTEIVAVEATQAVVETPSLDLFADANRCQGTVSYQAEIQNNELRQRLTCAWEVSPDEWGTW